MQLLEGDDGGERGKRKTKGKREEIGKELEGKENCVVKNAHFHFSLFIEMRNKRFWNVYSNIWYQYLFDNNIYNPIIIYNHLQYISPN